MSTAITIPPSDSTAPASLVVHLGQNKLDTHPERREFGAPGFLDLLCEAPRVGDKDGPYFQPVDYLPGASRDKDSDSNQDSTCSKASFTSSGSIMILG